MELVRKLTGRLRDATSTKAGTARLDLKEGFVCLIASGIPVGGAKRHHNVMMENFQSFVDIIESGPG